MHHGIQGQKWGVRRYQETDGTLTEEGRQRYNDIRNKPTRKKNIGTPQQVKTQKSQGKINGVHIRKDKYGDYVKPENHEDVRPYSIVTTSSGSYYVPSQQYSEADINLYEMTGKTPEQMAEWRKKVVKEYYEKEANRKKYNQISIEIARRFISSEMARRDDRLIKESNERSKKQAKRFISNEMSKRG